MSDNTSTDTTTTTTTTSPTTTEKKDEVSPEIKKVIERSQLIQAEIQSAQLENIKTAYELVKSLDEDKVKQIEQQFSEGVIRLDMVDDEGNTKPFTKPYVPLTTRAEEAVNKVIREVKMFKADVNNKLPLEDMQKKYPELMQDIDSLEELAPDIEVTPQLDDKGKPLRDKKGNILEDKKEKESDAFLTLIENYVTKKKAKIYFKIDDISDFPRKDIRALIFLYQYRNTYNPYYVNQT
jgi:hypothetical protein